MTDSDEREDEAVTDGPPAGDRRAAGRSDGRSDRLATALRENLRKRKHQARGRTVETAARPETQSER